MGDNWVLKQSNLRKLIRNLEHYYHEDLKKDADFGINLAQMARSADAQAITDLVELVAAAAVTCPEKGQYVSRIMNMQADCQLEMKSILESSLQRLSDYDEEEEEGLENELVFDQSGEDDEEDVYQDDSMNRNLFGANHLKDTAGSEDLQEQLEDVRRELAAAKSQATISAEDSAKAQSKLSALVEDLQDRLVKRQDELIQLEEDLKDSTAELEDLKSRLAEAEEQKVQLADDLDVANAKAQQLLKAEATVVAYRKKLDSVGVMNQQMTDLEDQAASYLRQIMELESEVKKNAALQKTVTSLQEKIAELEKLKTHTASSTQSSATEIADLKKQLSAAETAKKMYEQELTELRAQQEGAAEDLAAPVEGLSLSAAPPSAEQREKTMRLEIENKKLQEEIEKLKQGATTASVAAVAAAASTPASSADAEALTQQVARLQEALATKEKENAKISGDKDKLEAYTKRTLAKFQDKYLVALQECKAKLKEKQDKIEILETRSASERTAQKREERLLSSTIYELGLAIMQNRLKGGT